MLSHKRLLIGRAFWGFGDWIMMSSVFRMLNHFRPGVHIDLHADPRAPRRLLYLPALMGARYALVPELAPQGYDYVCRHLVYPSMRPDNNDHILRGMVQGLNAACPGLELPYEASMLAQPVLYTPIPLPEKYVVVPSC